MVCCEFEPMELELRAQGYCLICGVDEAGRGPIAGDVYAAAVILPQAYDLPDLNDSKKLSAKQRDILERLIKEQAVAWAVALATVEEIERINILRASLLAMKRAVEALAVRADYALVDGNFLPALQIPGRAVIKGDARAASVAAASILAKTARDRAMAALGELYPGYGFAQHKGYGTKAHYEALEKLEPCPIHRRTFLHLGVRNQGSGIRSQGVLTPDS